MPKIFFSVRDKCGLQRHLGAMGMTVSAPELAQTYRLMGAADGAALNRCPRNARRVP